MTNWRRTYQPGGTFFFTLVTENRAPILTTPAGRRTLRAAMEACKARWPLEVAAVVLLPDHLHTIWRLPPGDGDYPIRWAWLKKEFTKTWVSAGGQEQGTSDSRQRNRRRGVWQRRYWEHLIRDERDFARHIDYIHYNPVKHGYVGCAGEWPWSSFHRHRQNGTYAADWGCADLEFADIDCAVGE